ncbi:MAG: response regulator [gamma proteobacterium symbiont of Bathyaustriella thionipta]|nr:response regulator [gamma proteobacterium symbiont of Bathyaustriella thionipta]
MKKRILVIDDEAALTRMMKLNIEASGNYEVRTENSGKNAITAAREFRPDMIFLDVMMPDKSGDDVAADLKQDPVLKHIPFVFLTAIVTNEETGGHASEISGNTFLAKPVKKEELIATIEKFTA